MIAYVCDVYICVYVFSEFAAFSLRALIHVVSLRFIHVFINMYMHESLFGVVKSQMCLHMFVYIHIYVYVFCELTAFGFKCLDGVVEDYR